jgi:adenosylcobinamide kinase/adenosylcobinamide-phosphate guanylyltransferase
MARIILVTGGCRSGKSVYAQRMAESFPGRRAYVATCQVEDEEMRQRVDKHRQAREATQWETIEEPVHLAKALSRVRCYDVVLVDCLTLWVSNLMYQAAQQGAEVEEEQLAERCAEVLAACRSHPGTVVLVTNEVGLGVVPENRVARRFRDLVGRSNQVIAAAADRVTLMSCGIPICLKGAPT